MPSAAIRSGLIAAGWPPETVDQALRAGAPAQPGAPAPFQTPLKPTDPLAMQAGLDAFSGRMGRLEMLMGIVYWLLYFIAIGALTLVAYGNRVVNIVSILLALPAIILIIPITISLLIRRWHDLDQSGWLALFSLIPGLLVIALLLVVPGTKGVNKYGPQPSGSLSPRSVFLGIQSGNQ
jgi:uncharacterized membrane protein YhaH (DUF805 family)